MHYEGLDEAEQDITELLASCKRFLADFENSSNKAIYEPNKLVSVVSNIKTALYSSGVRSFVKTFSLEVNVTGDSAEKINPLIVKWINLLPNIDEQLHKEFLQDLADFSIEHPQFLTGGTPMLQVYEQYLWDNIFGKYENTLNGYLKQLSGIVEALHYKYEFYVNTGFITLSPYEFEQLIADLFLAKSYLAYVTPRSGDFGVDVIAESGIDKIAIQVKKYSKGNNVGNVDVQKILGGMSYKNYKATRAILITTSDFSKKALAQAESNPIELWDIDKLKREVLDHLCHK